MKQNALRDLLFPPKCMLCRRLLSPEERAAEICGDCRTRVLLPEASPREDPSGGFDRALAALWYEGSVRQALHGLKYYEKQGYARPLSRIMVYALDKRLGGDYDLVTFVPTNPGTQRRRGYNQAELLARAVAQRLALPCVPTLKKNRATQAMHGLTPAQRRDNVRDAYVLTVPGEVLLGKRVLLVDDILTTGATLSECGRALKAGGAAFVVGLCAASPRKGSAV